MLLIYSKVNNIWIGLEFDEPKRIAKLFIYQRMMITVFVMVSYMSFFIGIINGFHWESKRDQVTLIG